MQRPDTVLNHGVIWGLIYWGCDWNWSESWSDETFLVLLKDRMVGTKGANLWLFRMVVVSTFTHFRLQSSLVLKGGVTSSESGFWILFGRILSCFGEHVSRKTMESSHLCWFIWEDLLSISRHLEAQILMVLVSRPGDWHQQTGRSCPLGVNPQANVRPNVNPPHIAGI